MENEIIQFTHLHTHSPEGSLLDGFMRIDKAIDKAKRLGMDALGISDHGTMAAHEKFYNECKKAGIHPVLGMEAYLTPNKDFRKSDFDDVAYVEAENSTEEQVEYVFSFLTEQEVEESEFSWQRVEEITPKKENTRIYNIAKESYILPIVEKTLPEGQEIPKGKAARTRMANSYRKAQTLSNKKELYIKADTKMRDLFAWYPRMTHQMLIAINNEGYQNLLKLNAIGQMDGFYGKPRIDFEDIKQYGKGIAATTACLGGMVPQLILRGRPEVAKKEIQRLIEAFDEVYLEIQPSRQEDQHVVNAQLIEWSRELGVPLIATTDAHMVDKEEMSIHSAMTHIGTSYEDDNDISAYDSAYLMTPEEILEMGIPREALQNAYDLSHRCQVDFLENKETKFPEYDVPEGYTMDEYLRELTEQGLFDIMLKKDYIEDYQAYQERLDYELKIISDKKLSAYFVIVWDYINYAREQGIYVGPGRGSAAGSLIAYTLGVTNLDPLKYDLLFEREKVALVKFR